MNRTDFINFLASNIHAHTYLEIGVGDPRVNFNRVLVESKISVDPNGKAVHSMTSDEFFLQRPFKGDFDLIFIDGLHWAEQVLRDVDNSLKFLSPKGVLLLHDCNPLIEAHQIDCKPSKKGPWTGTVWKAMAEIRASRGDLKAYTVDLDYGIGIIYPGPSSNLAPRAEWTFPYLVEHRKEALGLMSLDHFLNGPLEELIRRTSI